jgi:hypothetical protein
VISNPDVRSMSHEFSQATSNKIQFDQEWLLSFDQTFFKDPADFRVWAHAEFKRYTFAQIFALIERGGPLTSARQEGFENILPASR